jgi:hypothetical protein
MPRIEDFEIYRGIDLGRGVSAQEVSKNPQKYQPYAAAVEALRWGLVEHMPVPPATDVSIVGKEELEPLQFQLRPHDRGRDFPDCLPADIPPDRLSRYSGRSAHILGLDEDRIPADKKGAVAALLMMGKGRLTDCLYRVKAQQLLEIGVFTIYDPRPRTKRTGHLILTPVQLERDPQTGLAEIPMDISEHMAELFQANRVR